ncbi:unnamed protein product [Adineta steineri]|uniref:Uncharacterized protein n=1 Tax=Adineta steineri TaxID=433720 RepID=A0A815ZMI8_9BILA|nr:unnamed protein product [Adineta steineri]CAF1344253.1 unnamed protein product [Adineta steineri]CAF1374795.1 unnamed protein product [Adineta steineri]CAF1474021.1 unnamed protein product [Adineta steineri]CAF1585104.1 unnamed protein product [Adineta steineri]
MNTAPYRETPGSVTLQSTRTMEYSRPVLTNIWHQKREAEPKDNDINKLPVRNMHISTYKQLATDGETSLPNTTTKDQQEQPFRERPWYTEQEYPRKMIDQYNINVANASLNGLLLKADPQLSGKVLPTRTSSMHESATLETTYHADYLPPYPYEMKTVTHSEYSDKSYPKYPDKSWGHRRMVSHFTDLDQPKRSGINTFHVQHAQYENEQLRRELGHFKPSQIL